MAQTDTSARHVELGLATTTCSGCTAPCCWPARRRADVAHAARRQDRLHHQRPGPRGSAGRHRLADAQAQDWMAPFYRSIASALTFGMSAEDIITAHLAKADDVSSGGRQMPGHYGGAPYNIVSLSSPVGTQVLHAVGIAMGAWVRGDDVVTMTSSARAPRNQGEVHEAMNFAGVHKLPVIFVCENNGYAISVPLDRQVAGGSVAARAAGYGMPGVVVDGGDVLGLLRGRQGGARPRAARRGPDAHRGAGRPAHRRTRPTTTSAATATRPRSRRSRSETRSRCSHRAAGRRRPHRRARRGDPGRGQGRGQRGLEARRGASRADRRRRARARLRRPDPGGGGTPTPHERRDEGGTEWPS